MRRRGFAALAVLVSALLLPAAAAAAPATTWQTVAAPFADGGSAYGTACATVARCYATGASSGSTPYIVTRDGLTVTAQPAPLPAGAGVNDTPTLGPPTCASASWCIAVGTIVHAASDTAGGLVETLSDNAVEASEVAPANGFNALGLGSVSCPAAGICYALGTESVRTSSGGGTVVSNVTPVVAALSAGTWTISALPVRAGYLSCPSTTWCVALSSTSILTLSGGHWSRRAIPTFAHYRTAVEVDALDCPAVGYCEFVGLDQRITFPQVRRPAVWLLRAGTWLARLVALPADAARGSGLKAQPLAVDCPGVTHCFAVGSYNVDRSSDPLTGLIVRRSGDTVTAVAAPPPTGVPSPRNGILEAISCPAVTSCDAVGYLGNRGIDEVWNGTRWSATIIPSVPGAPSPSALGFGSVSCPAAGTCFAAGGYEYDLVPGEGYQKGKAGYAVKS